MSKFNTTNARPAARSPIATAARPTEINPQGGVGFARDVRSELFLLAVSNMVGEATFYESANDRDSRFTTLVRAATHEDPTWTAEFLRWLRGDGNMRSASLVGAAEYAAQAVQDGIPGSRAVVSYVCQRADEPGEMLAYWTSTHGRSIPKPIKRGVADAATRLYTEKNYLKWDSEARGFRFSDVLDLTHPAPAGPWQSSLFAHILDERHGNADDELSAELQTLQTRALLMAMPVESRREFLAGPLAEQSLKAAGMTWESLAGWLQGPMDKVAWEAVIPSMGYMALLRNLRNFDQAGVSDEVARTVGEKLSDPNEVARSRQFPMRFLSAFKVAPSFRWAWPLEKALSLSLGNVPVLSGRTLILVDMSGSMGDKLSARSDLTRAEAAAMFGSAIALRCESADLVQFGTDSAPVPFTAGESVLKVVARFQGMGGTNTANAVGRHLHAGHKRVIIVTDEQTSRYGQDPSSLVPAQTPLYTWNLAGYRLGHGPSGQHNRHTFGGLTDAAFRMIPLLEAGRDGVWPWQGRG